MQNLENIINNTKNILLFTAHHDDEVLFTGGLIDYLYNKNINIHLLIATDYINQNTNYDCGEKHNNFLSIVEKYNIKYNELNIPNLSISHNVKDITKIPNYSEYRLNIIRRTKQFFKHNKFDIIFTHNENGEYGHPQHKLVNICANYLKSNNIINEPIFTFGNNKSNFYLKINLNIKHDLIKMYSFKDNDIIKNLWFHQCIKNYCQWCSEEYEYYNII
jgi:hypothetical protein